MNDLFLKVRCPNDEKKCLIDGDEIKETMILLGVLYIQNHLFD